MLYLASTLALALSDPTGSYSGSKSILGQTISATLNFGADQSTVDVKIGGAVTIDCAAERYTFADPTITLPNMGNAGDCIHDAIDGEPVSIEGISYSDDADTITVKAKYTVVSVSVVLSKNAFGIASSEAERQNFQTVTVAEHAQWFEQFKAHFGKKYATEAEHAHRFTVFRAALAAAEERNHAGEAIHGITKFSDLAPEEFRAQFLGYKPKANSFVPEVRALPPTKLNASASVDWRNKGILTPVKDQGRCGSCWAFSATEQIETDAAIATGKLYTLSPQQITSCDTTDLGCNGGNTETAYDYVVSAGGLDTEASYPYTSGRLGVTGTCKVETAAEVVSIKGYNTISNRASGESSMVTQMQKSPMSVCVDAESWQTYTSGIVGASCGTQLDHCVQAVGLTTTGAKPYWIVRNSWATDWGVNGYIYVQQGIDACGIAKDATTVKGAAIKSGIVA